MNVRDRLRTVLDERRYAAYVRVQGSPSIFLHWQPFQETPR